MCHLLESDEATVAAFLVVVILIGIFLVLDSAWQYKNKKEVDRLPTTINIRDSREEIRKQ